MYYFTLHRFYKPIEVIDIRVTFTTRKIKLKSREEILGTLLFYRFNQDLNSHVNK